MGELTDIKRSYSDGLEMGWYYFVTRPLKLIKRLTKLKLAQRQLRLAVKEAGGHAIGATQAYKKYLKIRQSINY